MINTDNKTQLVIVGYPQATITQEFLWWIQQEFSNVTVVTPEDLIPNNNTAYIISITKDLTLRQKTVELLKDYSAATFVHSSVIAHGSSKIMPGSFVFPNASVYFNSVVGSHCIIGPYSMVGHNSTIGTGTILHPGTMIAGSCSIGEYCLFGIRSTIIDKLSVCNNAFIGAGSLVSKNIMDPGNYVGFPCRKVS